MRNSGQLIQALLDIQDDPFVLIDRDCHIVAANRAYTTAYGVSGDAIIGRPCHEISHRSPVPCHHNGEDCPLQHVLSTGEPYEVVHVHYDSHNCPERVKLVGYPIQGADGMLYLGERILRLDNAEDQGGDLQMVGNSPLFLASLGQLAGAARTDAPILLSGESGVGKELAARFLHGHSSRRSKLFLALDCATFSQPLFESELFGHERGAFTGSTGRKKGLFELAHEGTLFLDEIGDISYPLQAKLLRVLETGEFRRVGGNDVLTADMRLITASNRNLPGLIAEGQFRQDLYYRIAGMEITLPPLRQRLADIPALSEALIARTLARQSKRQRLTPAALAKLDCHDYPGNIRELRNIILRAACMAGDKPIDAQHIVFAKSVPLTPRPAPYFSSKRDSRPVRNRLPSEAQYINQLLEQHDGHRSTVARIMGISERTLYRKLKLLNQPSETMD